MADQPQPVPVVKLQEDRPVFGNEDHPDLLGLEPFAKTLAGVALGTEGPFTIGIYGGWGVGKTSMLHMVKHLLEEDAKLDRDDRPEIVTVWFNPWQFECEEHPLLPLIGAIASALEGRAKVKGVFRDLHTCFKALLASIRLSGKLGGVEASIDLGKAAEVDDELRDTILKRETLYPEAFEKLEASSKALRGKGRIVVFVDDLDRCQPRNAIKLLEAVKLALGQPGFIFFLAVDSEIIEGYLAHVYKQDLELPGAVAEDGDGAYRDLARRYLHKLVQMDFPIPSHVDEKFNEYLTKLTPDDVAEDQRAELVTILRLGAGANPRSAARMVNRLRVQARLWEASSCTVEDVEPAQVLLLMAFSDVLLDRLGPRRFEQLVGSQEACEALLVSQAPEGSKEQPGLGAQDREVVGLLRKERSALDPLFKTKSAATWLTGADLRKAIYTFFQRTETISEVPETEQVIFDRAVRNALGLAPDDPIPTRRLGEVTALDLRMQLDFGDAGMALLSDLTNVQELNLGRTGVSDAGLVHLAGLTSLQHLELSGTQVSDAGLVHLAGLVGLETLNLSETQVTDAGLARLASLTRLGYLNLGGTQVTDAGLVHLAGLTGLRRLLLHGTQVSDAGLAHLAGLTALRRLILAGTQVSGCGVAGLQKQLAKCEIYWQ